MKKKVWMTGMTMVLATMTACSSGTSNGTVEQAKPVQKDGKTVLTLSVQTATPYYDILQRKFEEKYPNIHLEIQAFKKAGETMKGGDREKYQKTTNTALLSGQGADVYELSSLPVDDYINKNLFLDMNSYLQKDSSLKSDLLTNVVNAINMNGPTYVIPDGFMFRGFVGDGDLLKTATIDDQRWSWKEFIDISSKLIKADDKSARVALANNPPELLLEEMTVDNYSQLVDAASHKAQFDSPAFKELMEQVKALYDQKIVTADTVDPGKQIFESVRLFSPADLVKGTYSLFKHPVLLDKPHGEQSGSPRIVPLSLYGIREGSPVKEQAWQLLSFMLSDDMQSLTEREGFSLLKSVNDKQIDGIQKEVKAGSFKLPNGETANVPDESFSTYKQLLGNLKQYSNWDAQIINIIGEEAPSYFAGQKSLEEVTKLIQNRATTFLNE